MEKKKPSRPKRHRALFAGAKEDGSIPFTEMERSIFEEGINIVDLIKDIGLAKSKSEGRRLIQQGGLSIDDVKVDSIDRVVNLDDFQEDKILIRKGKRYTIRLE